MSDERIEALLRAARRRARSDEEYRECLEACVASGHSYVELARTLGISRQAVRKYVVSGRKGEL